MMRLTLLSELFSISCHNHVNILSNCTISTSLKYCFLIKYFEECSSTYVCESAYRVPSELFSNTTSIASYREKYVRYGKCIMESGTTMSWNSLPNIITDLKKI